MLKGTRSSRDWHPVAAAVAAAVCFGLWLAWSPLIVGYLAAYSDGEPTLGVFGDSFGALNTLFTGLAFIAVGWAAWMQKTELRLSREDSRQQRQEMQETRKILDQQSFEETFFKLLSLLMDHINAANSDGTFQHIFSRLHNLIDTKPDAGPTDLKLEYNQAVKKYDEKLGPFFKTLYTVLKMVDHDPIFTDQEKDLYGNIVRSQLSGLSVSIIGVACLSVGKYDGLRSYVVRFRLLKHIPDTFLRSIIERDYPESTFQGRDAG